MPHNFIFEAGKYMHKSKKYATEEYEFIKCFCRAFLEKKLFVRVVESLANKIIIETKHIPQYFIYACLLEFLYLIFNLY